MNLAVFLELVEIKAKTASILPFLIGICFSYYYYGQLKIIYLILFFIAMILFNMAVDVMDNYNHYKKAVDIDDYKQNTNIIGRENLSIRQVEAIMYGMIIISAIIGVFLSILVGWQLLLMGIYCYLVGIFYSFGPKPLSDLPVGEIFSGFTMGFMISLICVYINTYQVFEWNIKNILWVFLISLPNTLWISNLMLANNLCDKEEDEKNNRYTLVHYIGTHIGLVLFGLSNVFALVAIIIEVAVKIAPTSVLLTLLIAPFVYKQTRLLFKEQIKSRTFICAVKILAVGSAVQVATYFIGIIFK